MIVLLTDFGYKGPYLGLMKAVLTQAVPSVPVIDLFTDLPTHNITSSSHLLAACQAGLPDESVFLCVVDPGVGSTQRSPLVLRVDQHWYVGPGNGLFDVVVARGEFSEAWRITWQPERLSNSFHGRDLFAPVAAMLARGEFPEAEACPYEVVAEQGADLAQVIYIDHYGNLFTGLRASALPVDASLSYKGQSLARVQTFSDVTEGEPFCYENSLGLLEIAVNRGRADQLFGAAVGDPVSLL